MLISLFKNIQVGHLTHDLFQPNKDMICFWKRQLQSNSIIEVFCYSSSSITCWPIVQYIKCNLEVIKMCTAHLHKNIDWSVWKLIRPSQQTAPHATHCIINTDCIINTERITESNHLPATLQLPAWQVGAQQPCSLLTVSVSDVCLWTDGRCTSVSYEPKSEKRGPLLSSFSTNPIKCLVVDSSQCKTPLWCWKLW